MFVFIVSSIGLILIEKEIKFIGKFNEIKFVEKLIFY